MMHLAAMDIVATVAFGEDVHEFDCDSETPFHQQARIFYHQLLNVLGGLGSTVSTDSFEGKTL